MFSWSWISCQLDDQNSKFSKPEFRAGVEFRASSKIEIQNFQSPNFELELNIVPARRPKFKIFTTRISSWRWILSQLEDRNSKFSKTRISSWSWISSQLEDRNSKFFKTRMFSWSWIPCQLEDQNSKFSKHEFRAGVEFRASSKIEIQNFQSPNFELELNIVPARRSEFKIFKNPNFELELNFEPARRPKFKIFTTRISSWSWILSQLEDRNSKFSKPKLRAGVKYRANSKIGIQNF
jgi:hypothetical protein